MTRNAVGDKVVVFAEPPKCADVGAFEITADIGAFALTLGVDLAGSLEDRADLAAGHMNRSQHHMLASGLLLLSIRTETDHGSFGELLTRQGFEPRQAQKAMQYAEFVAGRPQDERRRLLEWPRSKVMELAGADQEVLTALMLDAPGKIDALSVRALRQKISDLEANLTDTTVQRDTAEVELEAARARLARQPGDREDAVPLVVSELRAEIVALQKKADLAVAGLRAVGVELVGLYGTDAAHDWADATLRLAVSALGAVRIQVDGVMQQYLRELPGQDPTPAPRSVLTKQEALETAQRFGELIQIDAHEKALRDWEAEQARPRGKGRPKDKPEAPGAVKPGKTRRQK